MSWGKLGKVIVGILIVVNLILAAWYVLHDDIIFHSDIARDFILLDEVVKNAKPTLLGPRTGAIPGIFHGPAWLYLNLPAYLLGGGDPVVVGWWWVVLETLMVVSVYYIGKKIFSGWVGLMAAAIVASRAALFTHQFFNPSGISLFFPLFFYCVWQFWQTKQNRYLIGSVLLAGLLIHFEIVFGLPMYLSVCAVTAYLAITRRIPAKRLLSLALIVLPLANYIVFDLRHGFIQSKALINYIQVDNPVYMTHAEVWHNRVLEATQNLGILTVGNAATHSILAFAFWLLVINGWWQSKQRSFFGLYLCMYIIFWVTSLLIPERIKGYYFDFSALHILILISQLILIRKWLAGMVFVWLWSVNSLQAKVAAFSTYDFSGNVVSSWQFNRQMGEAVAADAPDRFAIFTLDTDIFGYSPNYGVRYAASRAGKEVNTTSKEPVTYLLIAANTIDHPNFDVRWWKNDQVRINRDPSSRINYRDLYWIERYDLTETEVAVPEDPLLMNTKLLR